MGTLIIILSVIIFLLLSYLFYIKYNLKRIAKEIKYIRDSNSNLIISSELNLKELNMLIKEINICLSEEHSMKSEFARKKTNLNKMLLNISHDLKTPLTSSLGYVDILSRSKEISAKAREELLIVMERLHRLEELINSFFYFSKMTNSSEPDLTKENLISILESTIAHHYDDFIKEKREVIFNKNTNKYMINTNKEMLTCIFDNLIVNSLKHSTDNLTIDLNVTNRVTITFSNSLLTSLLDISRIFDEFYTIDISRTKGNTGLGLAIAKQFTLMLKGEITASKEHDKFIITLVF